MRVLQVMTAIAVLTMVLGMRETRAAEGFTTFGPKEAERKYESAVKQAKQTYLAELRRALSSMPATQIEEANRINATIKRLEADIAGRPQETTAKSGALEGKWEASMGKKALGTCHVLVDGEQITFVNETGVRSRGVREDEGNVIAVDWDLKGKLSPNGKTIYWSNGAEWKR